MMWFTNVYSKMLWNQKFWENPSNFPILIEKHCTSVNKFNITVHNFTESEY